VTIMVAVATLIGFIVLIGGLLLVHRSVSIDSTRLFVNSDDFSFNYLRLKFAYRHVSSRLFINIMTQKVTIRYEMLF